MTDRQILEADARKYQRSITFFLCQLEPVLAKRMQLERAYDIARKDFDHYLTVAPRIVQELKIKMRRVNECSAALCRSENLAHAINEKIDNNIKQLALAPCQAVCKKVEDDLPLELRNEIYHYLIGDRGAALDHSTNCYEGITVPQMCHLLNEDRSTPPFGIMQVWFDNQCVLEFIEKWYRSRSSAKFDLLRHQEAVCRMQKDIWGSPLEPHKLLKRVDLIAYGERLGPWKNDYSFTEYLTTRSLEHFEDPLNHFREDAEINVIVQVKHMRRSALDPFDEHELDEEEQKKFVRAFVLGIQTVWHRLLNYRIITIRFECIKETVAVSNASGSLIQKCIEKLGEGEPEDDVDEESNENGASNENEEIGANTEDEEDQEEDTADEDVEDDVEDDLLYRIAKKPAFDGVSESEEDFADGSNTGDNSDTGEEMD